MEGTVICRLALGATLALVAVSVARASPPSAAVWNRAGVLVAEPGDFAGPWKLADELSANGFSWVAIKLHDGLVAAKPLDAAWIDAFRQRGIAVGGWGVERTHPRPEAALAAELVDRYGLDFYIANAEATYKTDSGGVWKRSALFTDAFRALEPTLPAAFATYGAPSCTCVLPIDFAAWRRANFALLPEAYYNQDRASRPDLTVAHARRAGWSPAQVHPIIGVFHGYAAARYVPLLRAAGTRGFSVFLADAARPADYSALAPTIAEESAGLPVYSSSDGAAGAPVAVVPPALAGRAKEGTVLTVGTGAWTGSAPMTSSYEWQRCDSVGCTTIPGATASTYTLASADVGLVVRVVVRQTNGAGTATAVSGTTGRVRATPAEWLLFPLSL